MVNFARAVSSKMQSLPPAGPLCQKWQRQQQRHWNSDISLASGGTDSQFSSSFLYLATTDREYSAASGTSSGNGTGFRELTCSISAHYSVPPTSLCHFSHNPSTRHLSRPYVSTSGTWQFWTCIQSTHTQFGKSATKNSTREMLFRDGFQHPTSGRPWDSGRRMRLRPPGLSHSAALAWESRQGLPEWQE